VLAGVLVTLHAWGCAREPRQSDAPGLGELEASLEKVIAASGAEVGLYYRSLGPSADSIAIEADLRMHAASTMKVPVMMRLILDHQLGIRSLDESLPVTSTFRSIVDGSAFELPAESDSDTTFYAEVGSEATVRSMVDRMITWSSNLATNILIELAEPGRIADMLHQLDADSMSVLRGVEDLKAFEAGLSNTTTARALGQIMIGVAESEMFSSDSRELMVDILSRQHFVDGIPAGVPSGTKVANKTGWVTGINHDAAIVFPVMVRGHPAEDQGEALTAELSRIIWRYHAPQGA
jgi:beta-lactamase class A